MVSQVGINPIYFYGRLSKSFEHRVTYFGRNIKLSIRNCLNKSLILLAHDCLPLGDSTYTQRSKGTGP